MKCMVRIGWLLMLSGWLVACGGGATSDEGDTNTGPFCQPQLRRCNGYVLERCDFDGSRWETLETCDFGCNVDARPNHCYATCPPGHALCYQGRLLLCNPAGDDWIVSVCDNGCNDGVKPPACFVSCKPGSLSCDGDLLRTCNPSGNGYESPQTCVNGCNSSVSPQACFPACRPGTTRCFGSTTLETCNQDGSGWNKSTCDTGCNQTVNPHACFTDCKPNTTRCKDANTLETCNAAGNGWNQSSCADGCNGSLDPATCNSCKPKSKKCEADFLKTCLDSGIGFETTSCNIGCNSLSDPPACYGTCKPLTRQCSGNSLEECDPSGNSWNTLKDCGAPGCDQTRLECNGCVANKKRCSNGKLEGCKADGSDWTELEDCKERGCNQTALACYAVCKPGKWCDNNALKTCNSDGTQLDSETCDHGCDAGTAVCYSELLVSGGADAFVFQNQATVLTATASGGDGQYTYSWKPARGLSQSDIVNPTANPDATTTYTVTVTDGQGNTATSRVSVIKYGAKTDLQQWDEVFIQTPNNTTDPDQPTWTRPDSDPETADLERTVTGETQAAILLSPFVLKNVRISGTVEVVSSSDNDFIGFVFGYQNERQFYLFDWKMTAQTYSECGGLGDQGMHVKLLNGSGALSDCALFWKSDDTDLTELTILAEPLTTPVGWARNEPYRFQVDFKPGDITLTITRISDSTQLRQITLSDATFDSGYFGLFSYSQTGTRFSDVVIESFE